MSLAKPCEWPGVERRSQGIRRALLEAVDRAVTLAHTLSCQGFFLGDFGAVGGEGWRRFLLLGSEDRLELLTDFRDALQRLRLRFFRSLELGFRSGITPQ